MASEVCDLCAPGVCVGHEWPEWARETVEPEAPSVAVTRHPAMVEHLRSVGLVGAYTRVVEHATTEEVRGEWVVGVLPLALAALAERVTEVPLSIPEEWRGRELTLAELRSVAGAPGDVPSHGGPVTPSAVGVGPSESGAPPRRFAQFREAALRLRSGQDRRGARAEVDALLRAGVLHEVDLEWDDHADCAVECLRRTVSETAVRLDAVALCYHREVIEALRWGVTRMVEAIESWPDGGADRTATDALDHAARLRIEMDAAVAHIDREVSTAIGKGRGIAVLVTDGPWTADEAVVTSVLRDASACWRGWWLDWFRAHEEKIAAG